jgi:hypothetical protein
MPFSGGMDKENVVCVHNGILFSHKWDEIMLENGWNWRSSCKGNKPDSQRQVVPVFSHVQNLHLKTNEQKNMNVKEGLWGRTSRKEKGNKRRWWGVNVTNVHHIYYENVIMKPIILQNKKKNKWLKKYANMKLSGVLLKLNKSDSNLYLRSTKYFRAKYFTIAMV